MSLPYRTRRKLSRIGMVLAAVLTVGIFTWLCWVVWLERYVVYSGSSATLDFSVSALELDGELAQPPVAEENVPIYYNEGSDALFVTTELTQLTGYYITTNDIKTQLDAIMTNIQRLDPGTAVMIDVKDNYGYFWYNSTLDDAIVAGMADQVEKLVDALQKRGCYLIARVSSLRDWIFVDKNPSCCLKKGSYGWLDPQGYYWMDPTNATAINRITSIVAELREFGFDEVLLSEFRFPVSDQYTFKEDKSLALQTAMDKLIKACSANNFVLSFALEDLSLELPAESRCRIYLENVDASAIETKASQLKVDDAKIQAVFLSPTNDSRFNSYSVLRSIDLLDIIQAQQEG